MLSFFFFKAEDGIGDSSVTGVQRCALPILVKPPLRTASLESHEGLTISATPWTEAAKYKEKFPKKSPHAAGILAVEVSFRNDSDDSVKVNLSRIRLTEHLEDENKQEITSLIEEALEQAVLIPGVTDPTATRN